MDEKSPSVLCSALLAEHRTFLQDRLSSFTGKAYELAEIRQYHAQLDQQLLEALDQGSATEQSIERRVQIAGLDLASEKSTYQEAATLDGMLALLPDLWRYTFLRCSLHSRANDSPVALFQALLIVSPKTVLPEVGSFVREVPEATLPEVTAFLRDADVRVDVLLPLTLILLSDQAGDSGSTSVSNGIDTDKVNPEQTLFRTRRWQLVESLLREAEGMVNLLESGRYWKSRQARSNLVNVLAQHQQWQWAERVARLSESRETALCELAQALVAAARWEQARPLLKEIEEAASLLRIDDARSYIRQRLMQTLIKACQWEWAERVACSIEESHEDDPDVRGEALGELAFALFQEQRWSQALKIALSIRYLSTRVEVLLKLWQALFQSQRLEQAEIFFVTLEQQVSADMHPGGQAWILRDMTLALIQVQQWERAEQLLQKTLEQVNLVEDTFSLVYCLCSLVEGLQQAQRWEQAKPLLQRAEEQAELLAEEHARRSGRDHSEVNGLDMILDVLLQARRWERATEVVRLQTYPYARVRDLSKLAEAMAQVQDWEQAEQRWAEATIAASAIDEADSRAYALLVLGEDLATVHLRERARPYLEEAVKTAWLVPESSTRQGILRAISFLLAEHQWWKWSEQIARSLEDEEFCDEALRFLGKALIQAQEWERAEQVACSQVYPSSHLEILYELKKALVQHQQWQNLFLMGQRCWLNATTRAEAMQGFLLVVDFIKPGTSLAREMIDAFLQVEQALSNI